jgi:hypothetical protein
MLHILCSQALTSNERKHKIEEFQQDGNRIPLIKCRIKGKEYYLLIDTGASVCTIGTDYQNLFDLKEIGTDSIDTIHGTEIVSVYETSIILEEWLYFVKIMFNETNLWENLTEYYQLDLPLIGVLGYDFLSKYQTVLDFRRKQLITNN